MVENCLIENGIFLAVANSSATTDPRVASFPPKRTSSPPVAPSPDITSARETPINEDASTMIDDDMNYPDDIVLAANDAEQARLHGEQMIFLRKRIRQVNSFRKTIRSIDIILVIAEILIGCMVEES